MEDGFPCIPPALKFGFEPSSEVAAAAASPQDVVAGAEPVPLVYEQEPSAVSDSPKKVSSRVISGQRGLLVDNVLGEGGPVATQSKAAVGANGHSFVKRKKGAFGGVFVPTCETMWGVLLFLRFYYVVGHAGIGQALCAVLLSACCAFCTTYSMAATISSGGIVSEGGPYYMISRALGPCVGASVGIMYWLAFTMTAVLESLGAVETLLLAAPDLHFPFCNQVYGSALILAVILAAYTGINLVTRLGFVFAAVLVFTIFMYYFGLATAPHAQVPVQPSVTGLSFQTFKENWGSHYGPGVDFGHVLGIFFPCFTGILSGANRADVLKDPPKNIKQGTFAAITFSLLMYSSFMVLWGMVAKYDYLQGPSEDHGSHGCARILEDIVWNPFRHAAHIGIIVASISQALQCMVVAPRLLQSIAKDDILSALRPLAPLRRGEPKRALLATYIVAALLMLTGKLDLMAPLLSMCFLVAYAFMNFSCFALTWLRSPAWRPKGIHQKRWRMWYIFTAFLGFATCLVIMFMIDYLWAMAAITLGLCLHCYVNCRIEARDWGSALDGIRYQLALTSLVQLEVSQRHAVNWRPQVLILYRLRICQDMGGDQDHGILRFSSQLRKGRGFCVVACVLEADPHDEAAHQKAQLEKAVIEDIMREECISGFAEVVVSPSWVEGTNYIIQLTGLGGLSPNTVLLDWPEHWRRQPSLATDFVSVLRTALAKDKAVLAVRGLQQMPLEPVYGTIDIWWMIHDGGFLILLSWLLVQHKVWRKCQLRVFTITEGVSEEEAEAAAQLLTKTLRQRRLFDVDVEVILADDTMIEPYTYDWTLRVEDRHRFLDKLRSKDRVDLRRMQELPLSIDDLFVAEVNRMPAEALQPSDDMCEDERGHIVVSDIRSSKESGTAVSQRSGRARPTQQERAKSRAAERAERAGHGAGGSAGAVGSSGSGGGSSGSSSFDGSGSGPARVFGTPATGMAQRLATATEASEEHPFMHPIAGRSMGTRSGANRPDIDLEAGFTEADVFPPPLMERTGLVVGASFQPPTPTFSRLETLFERPDDAASRSAAPSARTSDHDATRFRRPSSSTVLDGSRDYEVESFQKLNQIIHARSKRAQLVVMNLPDLRCEEPEEVQKFMSYCDTLTAGLDRVLFVHASGHEIFDLSA